MCRRMGGPMFRKFARRPAVRSCRSTLKSTGPRNIKQPREKRDFGLARCRTPSQVAALPAGFARQCVAADLLLLKSLGSASSPAPPERRRWSATPRLPQSPRLAGSSTTHLWLSLGALAVSTQPPRRVRSVRAARSRRSALRRSSSTCDARTVGTSGTSRNVASSGAQVINTNACERENASFRLQHLERLDPASKSIAASPAALVKP